MINIPEGWLRPFLSYSRIDLQSRTTFEPNDEHEKYNRQKEYAMIEKTGLEWLESSKFNSGLLILIRILTQM